MTAVAKAERTRSWGPLTALAIPDLRNKILFTLAMVVVYRFGVHIPVPGVDFAAVQLLRESAESGGGVLGFLNLFSGGAITNFAIFALGVFPYITASIIMQLLQVVIPRLEEWKKEGATGQKKITQWTRYLAIVLALIQSTGLAVTFARGDGGGLLGSGGSLPIPLIPNFTLFTASMVVLTMTAGTVMVMWMGELITQRGIGQGMSMLIFANVVSGMLTQGAAIRAQSGEIVFAIILLIATGILVAIVIVESGQRRISVQFAKRVVGNRQYGGQATYIPLKVNQSGVVPVIFASSVLYFPALIAIVISNEGLQRWVSDNLVAPTAPLHILFYGLLIVAFAYFYTAIAFDPAQQADVLKRQGGYVPGIRPGRPTEEYLQRILNRIVLPGALFIAVVALVPTIALDIAGAPNTFFAGTTLLIAVGVALETMKQIDSQLTMRNYEGFLK